MELSYSEVVTRLGIDFAAGALAGSLVTPMISAVDRALAENASGKAKLWPSFFNSLKEYGARPVQYLRGPQFVYIWMIYGGTYCAANLVETVCAVKKVDPGMPKWLATSSTNTVTCIVKDKAFAQLFGTSVPQSVPLGAYAAWLSRDFCKLDLVLFEKNILSSHLLSFY